MRDISMKKYNKDPLAKDGNKTSELKEFIDDQKNHKEIKDLQDQIIHSSKKEELMDTASSNWFAKNGKQKMISLSNLMSVF